VGITAPPRHRDPRSPNAGFLERGELSAEVVHLVAYPGGVLEPEILRRSCISSSSVRMRRSSSSRASRGGRGDGAPPGGWSRSAPGPWTGGCPSPSCGWSAGRSVLLVVGHLDHPAALRLGDGRAHRVRHRVRVHQDRAVHVPGRPPDRLDQRGLAAQESLLVGVEDATSATSGRSSPSRSRLIRPARRTRRAEGRAGSRSAARCRSPSAGTGPGSPAPAGSREVLGHLLGEGGDEYPLGLLGPDPDPRSGRPPGPSWADLDLRVDQAGGPDDLFDHPPGRAQLVRLGVADMNTTCCTRSVNSSNLSGRLSSALGRRNPKSTRVPSATCRPRTSVELRHRDVRLVDHTEPVGGEVVEQRVRRGPGSRPSMWRE